MKNQYFGDLSDYPKYGLLRLLREHAGVGVAVCWMMTPDDDGPDGEKTKYLRKPIYWRSFDPELWDFLCDTVQGDEVRDVSALAKGRGKSILPGAAFYEALLPVDASKREAYLTAFLKTRAKGQDLVFFDPDNGLPPDGAPEAGHDGAAKYLYFHEAALTYGAKHSLFIYQTGMREPLDHVLATKAAQLREWTGAECVCSFRLDRSGVGFLLVPHPNHKDKLMAAIEQIREEKGDRLKVVCYE